VTLAKRLIKEIAGRKICGLVVGLPLELSGNEGKSASLAREIGALLADGLGINVEYMDERFSTKDVLARSREMGIGAKHARKDLDAWAAAAILQAFLDRKA
jgi:putative Holliday junction resolvase